MIAQTKTISLAQAVAVFAGIDKPQPVSIVALTEPEMRKTGNPYAGLIRKLSKVSGFIAGYENMVNNQLAREGKDQLTFTAKPRKWGERVSLALVRHVKDGETRYYVTLCPKHAKPFYLVRTNAGFLAPIAKALFEAFLPPYRAPDNQGTDKPIEPRDYNLANVASFAIGGQRYRIRHGGLHVSPAKPAKRPYVPKGITGTQIGQAIVDRVQRTLAARSYQAQ